MKRRICAVLKMKFTALSPNPALRMYLLPVLCAAAFMLQGCGTSAYEAYESVALSAEEGEGPAPQDARDARPYSPSADPDAAGSAERDPAGADARASGTEAEDSEPSTICAYICGAVMHSGVYTLPAGSRVYELVRAAGGLAPGADEKRVNQAELLTDGEQITVLTEEEALAAPLPARDSQDTGRDAAAPPDSGLININTADSAALQSLNGIGASRAADIIAWREREGGFAQIEDIMKVSGIKSALFEKIKDHITVG